MSTLFKKVASTISVGAILASSVGSSIVAAASGFLPFAEALADAKVITKQSTEAGYRLADNALRQEVVAMATALAKLTPADTCAGKFSDVSATKPNSWVCKVVEAALTNGLIAANATFRPEDKITRAEALAMILKGQGVEIPAVTASSFNDVKEGWQVNVAEVALSKKIISANASFRPNDLVTRGELFVMAANAAGLEIASDDLDLDDLFGDDDDTTSTGTTSTGTTGDTGDTGTVVKAGDLNVSLNPASPAENSSIPQAGIVRFATVDFKAGANDISVNSVEMKKSGLFSVDTSTRAWFEVDGMRISGRSSFTSEGNVVLSFAPALVIKAGATQSVDFIVELNGSSSTDYKFVSGELNTSAANVTGSFTTPTLRSSNYIVSGFNYGISSSDATYNVDGNEEYELGAFKIVATKTGSITETRDLTLKSIALYQNESADLANLKDMVLVRDGVVVSTKATVEGKNLVFSVNDTVKDGATAIYYVRAKVATLDNTEDKYEFYVKKSSDIVLYEVQSGVRATGTNTNYTWTYTEACYSNTYTLKGSDVSFSRDDSVSLSATYAPGSSNVILMKGYIEAKQAVNLEDASLNINVTNASGSNLAAYFSTAYMTVGNSSLSASAPSTAFADDDATVTLDFNGTVTVSGKVPVTVYVNLKSTSGLPSATFKLDELKLDSFTGTKEYVANGNTVDTAVGTVSAITATIGNSTLNVTRNDGLGDTNVAVGSKSVTVFGAQLSSTQGNPIRITSLTYDFASSDSSTGFVNNAYATLYVDGTAIKSKTINSTEVKFDGFNFDVSTTTSKNITLKVDFSDAFASGDFTATLAKYEATDTVSSTDLSNASLNLSGAMFTIANASATLAISNDTPKMSLVTAGATSTKLLVFRVTAQNDVINLKKVLLSGSKLDSFTNYSLKDSSGKSVSANSASGTEVLFNNISADTFKVNQDATADLYVYADAKTNTNTGTTIVKLNSMTIRGSNGKELTSTSSSTPSSTQFTYVADSVVSNGADVYENTAKIAAVSPVSKNIASDAMRFSITAAGKNSVTLNSLTLTGVLSGYTGAYSVEVRKVSDDTLISSGTTSSLTTVNFANGIVVDAGKTETYYIKLAGIAIDSGAQQSDWTLKLTNFVIAPITGATVELVTYPQNTDTLPLTSSK